MEAKFPKPGLKPKRVRKPLPRTPLPKARKRVPPKNPERSKAAYIANFSGAIDHDAWIRNLNCCMCYTLLERQATPTQAAHVVPRSIGGKWWSLIPACERHHRIHERAGNDGILRIYGISARGLARKLTREHLEEMGVI